MNRVLLALPLLLTGCLLLAERPDFDSNGRADNPNNDKGCVDAECPGGYTCDFDDRCETECVVENDCRQGWVCCLASNNCPDTDTRFFECIEGGW